jgi:hypothetical protein
MILSWAGKELPQVSERSWSTPTDAAFGCTVLTADDAEYTATVTFMTLRWSQKSTHPQNAIDGAARKAARWTREFSSTAKWLSALDDSPRPRGAPHGVYTMAKVPDSPEQAAWIAQKRRGKK